MTRPRLTFARGLVAAAVLCAAVEVPRQTIAGLLGVPPHPAWTGRPVGEALIRR